MDNYTEGKRGEDLKVKESIQKSDIYCKLFKVEPPPSSPAPMTKISSIRSTEDMIGSLAKVRTDSRISLGC